MKVAKLQTAKIKELAAPAALAVSLLLSIFLISWTIYFIRSSANHAVHESVDAEARTQLPKLDEDEFKKIESRVKGENNQ